MHKIIEDLQWRYATKKFDPTKIVSAEQLHVLKESIRLTASSYGLQPFKVLIIESKEIREALVEASYGQRPVADASHLFVFCAATDLEHSTVDAYMDRIASAREIEPARLEGFSKGIKNSFEGKSADDIFKWTSKQTYIALGHLLHTCASLRVDALPMEGFDASAYNRILDLDQHNLSATLACPVGFRHADDISQHSKKVRKSSDEFFEIR